MAALHGSETDEVNFATIARAISDTPSAHPTTVEIVDYLMVTGRSAEDRVKLVYEVCDELNRAGRLVKNGAKTDQLRLARWGIASYTKL